MAGIGLNTGLRALLSSQFVLETIGHNIANAGTPGYSRQRVGLSAATPLLRRGQLVGAGVDAGSVERTVDALLQRRLLTQTSVSGRLGAVYTGMSEVEALFGEPDGFSLGAQLDGFFGAVSGLSTSPADPILRTGVVSSAAQLASQFNQLVGGLGTVRGDTAREVAIRVEEVNQLAREISALNAEIASLEATGVTPNDLADRRDAAVRELAQLVDVETRDEPGGALRVLVGGSTLVSATRVHRLESRLAGDGSVELSIRGAEGQVAVGGGVLGGLVQVANSSLGELEQRLDRAARHLIAEVNRVHSTGIPAGGPFSSLTAGNALSDRDQDGDLRDELLSNAGLPYDVVSGSLFVSVTNEATGAVERHEVPLRSTHTTVGELVDALSAVPHLAADVDAQGRLQIFADAGWGFDFSRRLDPDPASSGTFGGGPASVGSASAGPFALADGDTLTLAAPASTGTPFTITLAAQDFEQIGAATAEEVAAVVNAHPDAQTSGLRAVAQGGRLFLQTAGSGSAASFDLVGGTALGALGLAGLAGTAVSGHDGGVDVTISGQYEGSANDVFTFRAASDGTIGTTPGLAIEVLDSDGRRVATLDVGEGYVPGTPLEVAQGVSVSFGLGTVSATHNDAFALDVLADSDTSDVLVALGLNSFFVGSGADDIAVRRDIELDPSRIASSASGSGGDNAVLLEWLDVEGRAVGGLGGATVGEYYGELVSQLGFDVRATTNALDANETLVASLELRREQVSGVNVDEELVDLLQYEQAFAAASRYITVLNELNDELLSLL